MRGSVAKQVRLIYQQVDSIGISRHAAKEEAKLSGASNWHAMGKHMGIHSYQTKERYLKVWKEFGQYARDTFKVRDLQRITPEHVGSFLEAKIASGVKYSTFTTIASALQKLEVGLNRIGEHIGNYGPGHYGFAATIAAMRDEARDVLERDVQIRAYESPAQLISAITNSTYQLAATMQHGSGARVGEIARITQGQLRAESCSVRVQGKGGKVRELRLDPTTYTRLEQAMQKQGGAFTFAPSLYRQAIHNAAKQTGQPYTGSHGLRWNFAQDRMAELAKQGMPYEQALVSVSQEMGHERGSITEHYLQAPAG